MRYFHNLTWTWHYSGPKNKRRKNKDRRRHEYYEEAVAGHGMPSSSAAVGGRDTRYNDMAPK